MAGYVVIVGAVPLALAQQVAKEMSQGLKVLVRREKYTEYAVPAICLKVRDEFMTVSESSSARIFY